VLTRRNIHTLRRRGYPSIEGLKVGKKP